MYSVLGLLNTTKVHYAKKYTERQSNYSAKCSQNSCQQKNIPTPGTFFLFFPGDAHRPNITPGGNKVVKKMVIKIRVG